ncbi:MAG: hypothetical protein Q7T55_04030, partial [Solirubrobacteraceae bacterium]|nr:hypothetical protein [Solirubrobacteraceae bacterium]
MEPLAIAVLAVLVIGVGVGAYFSRLPPPWDEIGGETPLTPKGTDLGSAPSTFDDEAELRAVVARKRARRQAAADGVETASDRYRAAQASGELPAGPPWGHLDAEVVDEARALVARKRARLERTGRVVPDEPAELERLLG